MNRFFRQYSRTLLMVFMALLLLAFLIQDVLASRAQQSRPGGGGVTIGTAFGRSITDLDLDRMREDLRFLGSVGVLFPFGQNLTPLDAHLLMEEASRAGIRVGEAQVIKRLQDSRFDDARMQELQKQHRRSFADMYATIGRWMAVQELVALQSQALGQSLPRIEVQHRDMTEEATVRLCMIDARALLRAVPEPTEADLAAFFEECKGRTTNHVDDVLQFGYLRPDRVRLEYVTVVPTGLEDSIEISESGAREFFDSNRDRYTRQAGPPVDGVEAPREPMSWEEARALVREDYRRDRAIARAQSVVNDIYNELRLPWIAQPVGEDGYRAAPAALGPALADLARKYSENGTPVQFQSILVSQQDLMRVPEFGTAAITLGGGPVNAALLAFRTKGLNAEKDQNLPLLTLNEPAPVLVSQRPQPGRPPAPYQSFLFRVTEVLPSAPPASVDEVKPGIVDDYKLAKAYAMAGEQARALQAAAQSAGLEEAARAATDLRALLATADPAATQPVVPGVLNPVYSRGLELATPSGRFTRTTSAIPDLARNSTIRVPRVAQELFKLAEAAPSATAPAHRVALIASAPDFRWIIAQLDAVKPLYRGPLEAQLSSRLNDGTAQAMLFGWFMNPDMIRARAGFVPAGTP